MSDMAEGNLAQRRGPIALAAHVARGVIDPKGQGAHG